MLVLLGPAPSASAAADDAVGRDLMDEAEAWASAPVALNEEVEEDVAELEADPSEAASSSMSWSSFSASGVGCKFNDFWANFLALG